ncbi:MAG: hypothetical protein ACI85F_001486 [Bacteroidia bacterium]|jgi:hypothetical protein
MQANSQVKNWFLFAVFLGLIFIDKAFSLVNFGFLYTDLDQTVLWNGAMDYSRGIFREPFFYGQAYNYMLEAFLAVPLLWLDVPAYKALPIITSVLSIFPFAIFGFLLMRKGHSFWAFLTLTFPITLTIEYGLLTTMPRGFVQAHLFAPLLFLPLLEPSNSKNAIVLFVASGACWIANSSSILIVAPIILWVFLHQFRSPHFYLSSLAVVPFIIVDYMAKGFYKAHPERVLHSVGGLRLDAQTFLDNLSNSHLFEHLFPFLSGWGILYPVVFALFALIAWRADLKKEFAVIVSIIIMMAFTLAIPKVHQVYENAGVFFTSIRLYLFIPILLVLSGFLTFRNRQIPQWAVIVLLFLSGIMTFTKRARTHAKVDQITSSTSFPIAANQDLFNRWDELKEIATEHKVDLIIHENENGWHYVFDSYVFNPLVQHEHLSKPVISVTVNGDRRTWLYAEAVESKTILLNGFSLKPELLSNLNHINLGKNRILIRLQNRNMDQLSKQLELNFGNAGR